LVKLTPTQVSDTGASLQKEKTMNTKIRWLILDRTNTAIRPCDSGYHGPGQQKDKSPSFVGPDAEANAKAFGDFLAKKHIGERFYLATVTSGVVQYTAPAPAGDWTAATVEGDE
jgi:hypothetical protein